ncbi:type II toxin-antitoxin system Phd/YefM family antitoxin [Acrocarpospora catenulata]|uniref:type II toxin-antitoxin system Phd/YefM family antitoxin n=1 Tax=Acrocarpospora catenulata TaxID=2836182 RepID=UPI001BDB204A|nr:hypothetical protein [Acrocarpospora catenulata]
MFSPIDEVTEDCQAVEITTRNNYRMPAAEYKALEETTHLLRSPTNASRLIASYRYALEGHHEIRKAIDGEIQE